MRKLVRSTRCPSAANLALLALLCICPVAAHAGGSERTKLVLQNTTNQPVEVGVVLAALGGACPASNPPVTADQLKMAGFCSDVTESGNPPYAGKCLLSLAPNSSVTFPDFPGTCLRGNVTFGGYPGCPSDQFPTGTTTAEFTLNPTSGDEAVDISLVNGFNALVSISMEGGGVWNDGLQLVSKIQNKSLEGNIGNPGVYPLNCTACTSLSGPPVCPGFPPKPVCQSQQICNVQRVTTGGTVTIALNLFDP